MSPNQEYILKHDQWKKGSNLLESSVSFGGVFLIAVKISVCFYFSFDWSWNLLCCNFHTSFSRDFCLPTLKAATRLRWTCASWQEALKTFELLCPWGPPPQKKRKRFAPPLAGSKPSPSNPFVTCKKMTAKIWISPNLIRALSESTGVGVRGEDGVQRKGVGNLPAPQHMAMVSLKAQYSIYFMQQHCPKKHASHISKYVNPKSNFSYLLLFLCFSFHRPAPLGVIFPLCIFLNALFFSLKSRAVGMECVYLLQPPVVLLSQIN